METKYHFKPNSVYCGDNLKVLKYFPDECVDLIYIDPPFFSGKNYDLVFGDKYAIRAFEDTFEGKKETYLSFMEDRIREMHRLLKSTGSFYLHCDWHVSHYLKIICDKIFGQKNFKVEIRWKKATGGKFSSKYWDSVDDSILFYTKSNDYTFNTQYYPYPQDKLEKNFPLIDEKGRFKKRSLKAGGTQVSAKRRVFKYKGCTGMWVNSEEVMDKLYQTGDLIIENNCLYRKQRPREGIKMDNFWTDIPTVLGMEKIGYPTQKPEALLERIILASSNKGDIILDAFAGCGTAFAVAQKLKRQWIGIDVSPIGCTVMSKRIGYQLKDIQGMKYSLEQAKKLDWMDFQKWTINAIDGIPLTKKGADKGIDGWQNNNKFNESIPVEVKQHSIGRPDVQKFNTVIQGEKKKGVFMIAFKISKPAIVEIKKIKRETKRDIVFISFDDLFNKETLLRKGAIKPTMLEKHFKVE